MFADLLCVILGLCAHTRLETQEQRVQLEKIVRGNVIKVQLQTTVGLRGI